MKCSFFDFREDIVPGIWTNGYRPVLHGFSQKGHGLHELPGRISVRFVVREDTLLLMRENKNRPSGIVYSTEFGTMCPACSRPIAECVCGNDRAAPAGDGIVRVALDTKGRKGKAVTVVSGLGGTADQLKDLARELKTRCGAGGTIKNWSIEIQGDHRDKLVTEFQKRGLTVKRL